MYLRGHGHLISLIAPLFFSGCIIGNRPTFVSTGSVLDGKVFYLDGAGNFGFGKESVPIGLTEAGYRGNVEHFIWTTYMGPLVDQMNLSHNRRAARALAQRIRRYQRRHPGRPVDLIGLSAGSGVAIFALEALPPENKVDHVVLLSSSLSAEYDLTQALRRVKHGVYVFWSPGDPVLRGIVPIVGTVDRGEFGARSAGTRGMRLPPGAELETKVLYRKVFNVEWKPGEAGGTVGSVMTLRHAETTRAEFIRAMVGPLLLNGGDATLSPWSGSGRNATAPPSTPWPPAGRATRPSDAFRGPSRVD